MDAIQYYKDLLIATQRELIRYRFWAALVSTCVFVVMLAASLYWPERYQSTATISMDVTNVIEPLLRGKAEVVNADARDRVADTILTRRVLKRAIENYAKKHNIEYSPADIEQKIIEYRASIKVETVNSTSALTNIYFSSSDPNIAFDSLDAVVNAFLENKVNEKQRDSLAAFSFIDDQVKKYKDQLMQADKNLQAFKADSVDVTEEVVRTRIGDLSAQIKDLKIAMEESQETLKATQKQLSNEQKYLNVRTKLLALEDRKVIMVEELDRLRLSYQDSYPDVVTLKNQLSEVNKDIEEYVELMGGGSGNTSELPLYEELRKQYAAAELLWSTQKRRLIAIEKLLEEERALADEVTKNQTELADLTRDYDVNKGLYEEMLGRKENAKLTMALNNEGQGENYRLLQPPMFPIKPSSLNPLLILLVAPVLSLLVPIGLVFMFVMLDPRMRSLQQLKKALPTEIILLGVIPHQSTPLNIRLLRKDALILVAWLAIILASYGYAILLLGF